MATCGHDLERAPRDRLAVHVHQVTERRIVARKRERGARRRRQAAATREVVDDVGQYGKIYG
jgi:hypothetical protein